ncbi:bacitracin ABC transporter ATP-binding protein [Clostridia bacterium]|nr:bacitracin ABC transporter ATP-binding protein [Clostridia bacterium]
MTILQTNGVSKRYGKQDALSNVSIKVEEGKVYGLIGQNGAGKTTLMRLAAGLGYPTSGSIELFGNKKGAEKAREKIGCVIESPALYPDMTANQNIELQQIVRNRPDKKKAEELLHFVGLSDTGHKKAKNFSLGMRQRLGLAIALIGDPKFLILDEPINGLDPTGIAEMRKLIKSLATDQGLTILVSSHILSELAQTASEFIIIDKGKIIEQLSAEEIEAKSQQSIIKLENFEDASKAINLLTEAGISATLENGGLEDYYFSVIGGAK